MLHVSVVIYIQAHMHMIYLGITIHVAGGIYVYGMMTTCWISSYTNIRQCCIIL